MKMLTIACTLTIAIVQIILSHEQGAVAVEIEYTAGDSGETIIPERFGHFKSIVKRSTGSHPCAHGATGTCVPVGKCVDKLPLNEGPPACSPGEQCCAVGLPPDPKACAHGATGTCVPVGKCVDKLPIVEGPPACSPGEQCCAVGLPPDSKSKACAAAGGVCVCPKACSDIVTVPPPTECSAEQQCCVLVKA